MSTKYHPQLIGLLLAVSTLMGCSKLKPGYYLTPENLPPLPTSDEAESGEISSDVVTATPVSTIQPVDAQPTSLPTPTVTPEPPPTEVPLPTVFTCNETEGQIIIDAMNSGYMGDPVTLRIYLPPCYEQTAKRYPYLIMLHGLGDGMDDEQWDRMGLDEAATAGYLAGTMPPMVIVMPDGTEAQHGYDPGPYHQVIAEEIIPYVESIYCTWGTPSTRAIGGLSRGGFWAYSVAFLYPELFNRVGAHSGFFYAGDYPATNPYDLVSTAPGIEHLIAYLDYGADDTLVNTSVEEFAARLVNRGLDPEFIVNSSGTHNEEYWSAHVADYLSFYSAEWPLDPAELPDCNN